MSRSALPRAASTGPALPSIRPRSERLSECRELLRSAAGRRCRRRRRRACPAPDRPTLVGGGSLAVTSIAMIGPPPWRPSRRRGGCSASRRRRAAFHHTVGEIRPGSRHAREHGLREAAAAVDDEPAAHEIARDAEELPRQLLDRARQVALEQGPHALAPEQRGARNPVVGERAAPTHSS